MGGLGGHAGEGGGRGGQEMEVERRGGEGGCVLGREAQERRGEGGR